MLTPKQSITLNKLLQQSPAFADLITRLDCTPIPSDAFKKSQAISNRVSELLNGFMTAPTKPRTVLQSTQVSADGQIIDPKLRNKAIMDYLVSLYGPLPWKYPLPFAPF